MPDAADGTRGRIVRAVADELASVDENGGPVPALVVKFDGVHFGVHRKEAGKESDSEEREQHMGYCRSGNSKFARGAGEGSTVGTRRQTASFTVFYTACRIVSWGYTKNTGSAPWKSWEVDILSCPLPVAQRSE